jgi:hypothetical protein
MGKLDTATFVPEEVINTKIGSDIAPMAEYLAEMSFDTISILNNGITFTDNFKKYVNILEIKHGVPIILSNLNEQNIRNIYFKCTTPILTYKLYTIGNTASLTVWFKKTINVLSDQALWQAGTIVRYRCKDVSNLLVGDVVKVSGFGTSSNNGTLLVTEIDTTNNYIYVNNRQRTSATGDETRTSFAGSLDTSITTTIYAMVD